MKSLNALDPLFEHRARLAAAVLLARHGEISFSAFKQQLDMTDGNLGAQLRKLEDAGYVKPVTWYSLTADGKKAVKAHIKALQALINLDGSQ